ncbi:putative uncharacterized protein [Bacteroides sp. CAG:927]|nr:putative uncharacterized protein [Bacteroides sp. CAG:927]
MSDFKPKGHLAMIAANAMWGLMSPAAKVVLTAGTVTPLLLTDMRIAGAAILFWFTSLFTPYEKVPPGDLLRLAGAACLGILFNQGCFIFGVGLSSPGEASIITTTMPMWVMVLAALILEEPITWKKAGGILLGASGAIMLVSGNLGTQATGNNPLLGDILVLTAQLSYALYLTLYRNFIRRYSLITLMKWMFLFATLILSIPSIPTVLAAPWASINTATWAGISFIVVGGTFVAYICVMIGQKNLRPTIVGMYNYLQPIVATAIGIYMGFDHFTVLKTIAVLLIFTGVYLVTISKARQ